MREGIAKAMVTWLRHWVLPVLAYVAAVLIATWFDPRGGEFLEWFLPGCLGAWDLYLRLSCRSVPTGRGSGFKPGLVDRLTFRDCGLTLWLLFLPLPVWIVGFGGSIALYRVLHNLG